MQEQIRQEAGVPGGYSRFDGVPLRALDIIIGICVFAFIAVIAVGIMKARGIL